MCEYDVGLVCLNGHPVNSCAASSPEFNSPFCSTCGEQTVSQCGECRNPIRELCHIPGAILPPWRPSAYCHACGKPYPWTERRADTLNETLDELDELSEEDREKLKKSIPDILAETPQSGTAVLRFKKAVAKVGTVGGKVLTDVLVKVAAESIKKQLGL